MSIKETDELVKFIDVGNTFSGSCLGYFLALTLLENTQATR